jgi:hypothetical protein
MDMVLGVDIHFEMVPMPAPVPTPIPNPFVDMVFDPAGLLVGQVMSLTMAMLSGTPGITPPGPARTSPRIPAASAAATNPTRIPATSSGRSIRSASFTYPASAKLTSLIGSTRSLTATSIWRAAAEPTAWFIDTTNRLPAPCVQAAPVGPRTRGRSWISNKRFVRRWWIGKSGGTSAHPTPGRSRRCRRPLGIRRTYPLRARGSE